MSLTENTESETIDTKALQKEIFSLAGPTMFEQLLQSAVNYIDTAMVGSIGTLATAAVGSTMTANWLLMGSISAVGVGFQRDLAAHDGQHGLVFHVESRLFRGIVPRGVELLHARFTCERA